MMGEHAMASLRKCFWSIQKENPVGTNSNPELKSGNAYWLQLHFYLQPIVH
jgi:hypothetical protein